MSKQKPQRYTSFNLPAYAYVPKQNTHPKFSSRHQLAVLPSGNFSADLSSEDTFLYGIDLFNLQYFWEAHELWERLWIHHGRKGKTASGIQALILISAALLKCKMQNRKGAKHLLKKAEIKENLSDLSYVNIAELLKKAEKYIKHKAKDFPIIIISKKNHRK